MTRRTMPPTTTDTAPPEIQTPAGQHALAQLVQALQTEYDKVAAGPVAWPAPLPDAAQITPATLAQAGEVAHWMVYSREHMIQRMAERGWRDDDADPWTPIPIEELAQQLVNAAEVQDLTEPRWASLPALALRLDATCVEAYTLLGAVWEPQDLAAAEAWFAAAEATGKRNLDPALFQQTGWGTWWGSIGTRPYMRARACLALVLWQQGKFAPALKHYQALLRLNPNDNQGNRYCLVACALEAGNLAALERGLRRWTKRDQAADRSAGYLYPRAAALFAREGDSPAARAALRQAVQTNPFVPDLVLAATLGSWPAHPESVGSPEEAANYASMGYRGWRAIPGALAWLAAHTRVRFEQAGYWTVHEWQERLPTDPQPFAEKSPELQAAAQHTTCGHADWIEPILDWIDGDFEQPELESGFAWAEADPAATIAAFWQQVESNAEGCWYWVGADRINGPDGAYLPVSAPEAWAVLLIGDETAQDYNDFLYTYRKRCGDRQCIRPDHQERWIDLCAAAMILVENWSFPRPFAQPTDDAYYHRARRLLEQAVNRQRLQYAVAEALTRDTVYYCGVTYTHEQEDECFVRLDAFLDWEARHLAADPPDHMDQMVRGLEVAERIRAIQEVENLPEIPPPPEIPTYRAAAEALGTWVAQDEAATTEAMAEDGYRRPMPTAKDQAALFAQTEPVVHAWLAGMPAADRETYLTAFRAAFVAGYKVDSNPAA